MAYTDRRPDSNRAAKILAVSAFQVAAMYAIAAGLNIEITEQVRWVLPTDNYPEVTPPPPPPETKPPKAPEVIDFVRPVPLPVPHIQPIDALPLDPVPLPIDRAQLLPPPDPVPSLKFNPKLVQPRNDPGRWVTTNDYPTPDIRAGNEGTARFPLSIDSKGKVRTCEIVGSSGHPRLDAATCKNVSRRARFKPANNAAGERIAETYSGTVRWVIPED